MRNRILVIAISLVLSVIFVGCKDKRISEAHFITDFEYRELVRQDFETRKPVMENRAERLLSIFELESITLREREALEFLYAYLPLHDLAEYDGDFFLRQVRGSFRAKEYFSWGKNIPEEIFRHFVVVPRAGNESLDDAREVFFEELKERVKDLSMYDAALEVNHWCHEKVTYRSSDGRTMAPLALAKTAWGRCGEEAVFTVTAMRAVGIPARQVSTPRWAHTDDNHAWVEVWVDGRWYFLGACEPEPELDMAWFAGPARRAMLVESVVVGRYNGPEQKTTQTQWYSRINSLPVYADARDLNVKVVDKAGLPVEGATVRFKVYNYGQLTPIYTGKTGADGQISLTTGYGDVMLWASKDDNYAYVKSAPEDNEVIVRLTRRAGETYKETFVMNPPAEQAPAVIANEKAALNARRLIYEDSLRMAYMTTFAKREDAAALASEEGLQEDEVWALLKNAEGNWSEIALFISDNPENPYILPFLKSLRAKDLMDTPAEYLADHFAYHDMLKSKKEEPVKGDTLNILSTSNLDAAYVDIGLPDSLGSQPGNHINDMDFMAKYVLSPRIALEKIEPWRHYFLSVYDDEHTIIDFRRSSGIASSVKNEIKIEDEQNYYNIAITPRGVDELKVSDQRSRNIYWVALVRSTGEPARIEAATGKPQYYNVKNEEWVDISFGDEKAAVTATPKGKLTLGNNRSNIVTPGYYSHFTLAKFENGDFSTLDLDGSPVAGGFPMEFELDEGYYRLMAGSRANDGSVTVAAEYFNLSPANPYSATITLPKIEGKLFVKGVVDPNTIVVLDNGAKTSLKPLMNNKGLILIFADPDREPTKHILQDMPAQATALEEWGGGVLFMVPGDKVGKAFNPAQFEGLPAQTLWGIDKGGVLLDAAVEVLQLDFNDNFPLVLYLSSNGGILYSSAGYRIGTGEALLKTILQEKATRTALKE